MEIRKVIVFIIFILLNANRHHTFGRAKKIEFNDKVPLDTVGFCILFVIQ
jgi:hypothetical protein